MKPIKISIQDKGTVYWDDKKGRLTGDRVAVEFLRKKINSAVISHEILVFSPLNEEIEDPILATMGYRGMYSVLMNNNIPLPDEIIAYYLVDPDLIPKAQLTSYFDRLSSGEIINDDPIIIPNVGSVYWETHDDKGELVGDEKAVSYLRACFQKAEKMGLTYSIQNYNTFTTSKVLLSDIQDNCYDSMIAVLNFFQVELPRYLYEYSHYEQPGIIY